MIGQDADPFHDPGLLKLDEVLAKFELLPNETTSRKARVRTAVSTICRLLHKTPDTTPAHPTFLSRQFRRIKQRPTGLSRKSLSNCMSELRYLLRTVCGRGSPSSFGPLTGNWLALREAHAQERLLWVLSRFMTFCCAKGINPDQVEDSAVAGFRTAITSSEELSEPEKHIRQTIMAWNRLAQGSPDWPTTLLTLEPLPRRGRSISPESFAPSFQQDVDRWLKRMATADPEDEDGGPHRACRPSTLQVRRYQLYQAASALVMSGRPIGEIVSLADIVQLDAFKSLMRYLREHAGGRPTFGVLNIAEALASAARHHVRVDDPHIQAIGRIRGKYAASLNGAPSKRREKLNAFEDDRLLAALLQLPNRLIAEALSARISGRHAACRAMVAVGVEIEILAPLRRTNLVRLNLHQHIRVITVGRERRWIISIPAHETKNRATLTYEMPAESVRTIERAMRLYPQKDGWLFPGTKGSHMAPGSLGIAIQREVERHLGVPFHMHLFRSIMASLQIKEHENGFERARALLGDRSEQVVRKHYTSTADRHLIAKAQNTIEKVRIRTAALAPAERRARRVG